LTLAAGDTADAIARLRALSSTAPRDSLLWDLWEPLAAERYLLATLLLARGSYAEARDVASVFDHSQPIAFVPFVAASLGIRLRASVALGDETSARRYRTRLQLLHRADLARAGP
jgi:Tfp pilus assembly protein PilF